MKGNVLRVLNSRIHKLKTINCFIKREDELLYGSKIRKYISLLPTLKNEKVILVGSLNSNNILIGSQFLIQNNKKPILFVKGTEKDIIGNSLLTCLFIDKTTINFIERKEWKNLNTILNDFLQKNCHEKFDIIKEGASNIESIFGSMTLCDDIIQNEIDNNIEFNSIFIDSGTGTTAISLILKFSKLQRKNLKVFVIQMNNELNFEEELFNIKNEIFGNENLELIPYEVLYPNKLKSFGSTNKETFQYIKYFAQNEGVLLDPVYNAKLFLKSSEIIKNLTGNSLIIHSGGNIFGFHRQLKDVLDL
eukprot:gene3610-6344_t